MQRRGSEWWRRKYCLRWMAESALSWIKCIFGEYVTAKNERIQIGNRRHHKHLCNKAEETKKVLHSLCILGREASESWDESPSRREEFINVMRIR